MADFTSQDVMKHLSFGQGGMSLPKSPSAYGNWQRYAGMDPYAPGLAGNMANPASFGQYQNFSGMGAAVPPSGETQAVPPTFAQVKERFGQVADQLKQGNIMDAMRTYQYGPKPAGAAVPGQTKPQTAVVQPAQDDMMSSEFGD